MAHGYRVAISLRAVALNSPLPTGAPCHFPPVACILALPGEEVVRLLRAALPKCLNLDQ
jgi:hypothetical protein